MVEQPNQKDLSLVIKFVVKITQTVYEHQEMDLHSYNF